MTVTFTRRAAMAVALVAVAACGSSASTADSTNTAALSTTKTPGTAPNPAATDAPVATDRVLKIGAIPDGKPEKLLDTNTAMAALLSAKLGVKVEFVPVNDYPAAVTQFRNGDLDLVWFGGLTGVQASLQTPGSMVLAQRDIDDDFHSVFIVNADTKIAPLAAVADLTALKGLRFTFGSEASTSGRLMPEYFLSQAGIDPTKDFDGPAGFSGSHDKTLDLVAAGTFEAGVMNEQVWKKRSADGSFDTTKVIEVLRSPGYRDYHWIAGPATEKRFGAGFTERIKAALLSAESDPNGLKALGLLGAKKFIAADAANYGQIEEIGRKLGLIS
jgi:phosphonate transport system substrate-binding protein